MCVSLGGGGGGEENAGEYEVRGRKCEGEEV